MILHYYILLTLVIHVNCLHFNGGTITWAPVDPYTNSSPVIVTVTQSYSWSFPTISCANNVPISTPGRSTQNSNLMCVVDCSTDGGYSGSPIDILTDCKSSSTTLGMMSSSRSKNISLTAGAYFSLAYQGSAWRSLGSPALGGLDWSILTSIDLRPRTDGFINTPPVATVVSPQYVVFNESAQIKIPVSDANGDDVRCRWSAYQPGYRRRRREDTYDFVRNGILQYSDTASSSIEHEETILVRQKRGAKRCSDRECKSSCGKDCPCSCSTCVSTTCPGSGSGSLCAINPTCPSIPTTKTTRTTFTTTSTTPVTTTSETMGTIKPTSSFPTRQAVDECGGICFPNVLPNTTTLANCTLSFKGLVPGTWYAVSVQVCKYLCSKKILENVYHKSLKC